MKLCVDLGATNIKSALVDNYSLIKTAITPTNTTNGLAGIIKSLRQSIDVLMNNDVEMICISSAGKIDSEVKRVVYATDNLPGYTGFDIGGWVFDNYKLQCVAINDGLSALLGEIALKNEYRSKKIAMLTLGSGVGGAYSVNGRIKADSSNDFALFGHIIIEENGKQCNCGKCGCAEQYLSGRAINKLAFEYGIEKDKIFVEYKNNNSNAVIVIEEIKNNMTKLLNKIMQISPFDICVLGGGVIDGIGSQFDRIFGKLGFNIVKAKAGNWAGVFGAYYLSEII